MTNALQGSYEDCLRNFYILDEINKSLARANAAGGVQGEGEQQKKSDMASHYAKKFEDLYEVFNQTCRRRSRQKVNKRCGFCGESTPLYLYNQQKAHTFMFIEQPPADTPLALSTRLLANGQE